MTKAIILGVFFVFLCVSIPGLVGLFHSFDQNQVEGEKDKEIVAVDDAEKENEAIEDTNTKKEVVISDELEAEADSFVSADENTMRDQNLAFTREEAVEAILDQFTLTELLNIYASAQNGLTEKDKNQIMTMLEDRFNEEEIEALKVIGFSELEKVLQ